MAGYPAPPEACLVNYYSAGAKMGSHRDEDEAGHPAPVVSVSLGDDATFHVGGLQRAEPKRRLVLSPGTWWCSPERRAWPTTASTASTRAPRACCRRAGG